MNQVPFNDTLTKTYASYNELLSDLIYRGAHFGDTKAILNARVIFRPMDLGRYTSNLPEKTIMMPKWRGVKETKLGYPFAEAQWYLNGSRDVNEIADFAPLWKSMANSRGKVNSNYGYQIRVNHPELCNPVTHFHIAHALLDDVRECGYGEYSIDIINPSNMMHDHDTVCNNRVTIYVEMDEFGAVYVNVRVVARSIDVIFGLPYDAFMAQCVGQYVVSVFEMLGVEDVSLCHTYFDIANVHIYNDDAEAIVKDTDARHRVVPGKPFIDDWLVVSYDDTPFKAASNVFHEMSTAEDEEIHRENAYLTRERKPADLGKVIRNVQALNRIPVLRGTSDALAIVADSFPQVATIVANILSHEVLIGDSIPALHKMLAQVQDEPNAVYSRKIVFVTRVRTICHITFNPQTGFWMLLTHYLSNTDNVRQIGYAPIGYPATHVAAIDAN